MRRRTLAAEIIQESDHEQDDSVYSGVGHDDSDGRRIELCVVVGRSGLQSTLPELSWGGWHSQSRDGQDDGHQVGPGSGDEEAQRSADQGCCDLLPFAGEVGVRSHTPRKQAACAETRKMFAISMCLTARLAATRIRGWVKSKNSPGGHTACTSARRQPN